MNHVNALLLNPHATPKSYWKNTSDNAIIRTFIEHSGSNITPKFERLLAGGYIIQKISEDMTYDFLHSSEENLWSILYLTGYLTQTSRKDQQGAISYLPGELALKIPNAEIMEIFENTIASWFEDNARTWNRKKLFFAVWNQDIDTITIETEMTKLLRKPSAIMIMAKAITMHSLPGYLQEPVIRSNLIRNTEKAGATSL